VGFDIPTTGKETIKWEKDCTKGDLILFLYHLNHMLGFYSKITPGRGLRFKISSMFSCTYYFLQNRFESKMSFIQSSLCNKRLTCRKIFREMYNMFFDGKASGFCYDNGA
jgi:hypothetical protein